ncbi:hypothetical protein BDD12DRAFT_934665 [Trichophaea hybrida]|nr:hypothetical protein BDD12DRAFT_934665 [Trichophaea hybrida]
MPRKGNKGLQKTLSTVVLSAFETQENDKTRREQIAKDTIRLQEEIGSLKNQVEELKTTVKNLLEEKSAMGEKLERLRASAVATTPPPPEKKKTIRPTPTPVVPLATQVLK